MTSLPKAAFRVPLFLIVTSVMTGCLVGPDFTEPKSPDIGGYTTSPLSSTSSTTAVPGGESQRFVQNADIPGEWWKVYHSKPLDDLVERALRANPNITAAQAALKAARENTLAQEGAYWPSLSGGFSAQHAKSSSALSPVTSSNALVYDLYTPQVGVSFVPDVFGLNRRTVEAAKAQEEQTRYQLAATYITLSSNVVVAAIQEASLRAQIDATRQLIGINNNMLQVMRDQYAKGNATTVDIANQESQLSQMSATLPPLQKQLAQQRDLLAALAGGFPSHDLPEKFELSDLQLPEELPVSLPSRLIEQRPDIRQAEENMHAASAQIGIAVANRLPNFNLTANLGATALAAGQLFTPGVGFWTLAGGFTQPIFDGGILLHKERAARDAYVQAAEQYRGTVITAVQNVADSLNALEQDANALKAAAAAEHNAKVALDLAQQQVETGQSNLLVLLNTHQAYQQALLNRVQAQANRYSDTAALFQALGGGWWNRTDLSKN